jgi:hypothetical protein
MLGIIILGVIMLSVIIPGIIMMSIIILGIIMLSIIILGIIMLSMIILGIIMLGMVLLSVVLCYAEHCVLISDYAKKTYPGQTLQLTSAQRPSATKRKFSTVGGRSPTARRNRVRAPE